MITENKLHGEQQYLRIVSTILDEGAIVPNRTGVPAITIPHMMIHHDMSHGFPLLTTKKMAWKTMKVELEGFIKGVTDKKWFQDKGCKIWDEWCNPQKIPPGLSEIEKKEFQLKEPDLGNIYGYQWRNFNSQGYDQIQTIIETLKNNPNDRRMVCSAWNPLALKNQALPPCHVLFHLTHINGTLNLCWFQRSVDVVLGLPFNLASYSLLLHLFCKQSGFKEGVVTGFLSNCHIYDNHIDGARVQIKRDTYPLPTIQTEKFTSIFEWGANDTILQNYQSHPKLEFAIAI